MSSQYKENNFSTKSISSSSNIEENNINRIVKPNIDNLIKRIHVERRREKKIFMAVGSVFFSAVLVFYFF